MKQVILIVVLALTVLSASAQKYSVRPERRGEGLFRATRIADSLKMQKHLDLAGICLQKSAGAQTFSWGLATAAGAAYGGAITKRRSAANILGTAFAVSAVAAEVWSVSLKMKAGRELRLSAGSIAVKF